MRRFEFLEGGSQKFWEIDQKGQDFTVRFGRVGSAGQSKTTSCASADEAIAEVAKLVREKTKKGYQEIGGGAAKALRPPAIYSNYTHPTHFMNFSIAEFDLEEGGLKDLDRKVYAVRTDYDSGVEAFNERLDALLDDPKCGQLKGLVIGNWYGEICESPPDDLITRLVEAKSKLTSLVGIFFGDVVQEENEISWLHQTDMTPLLQAYPKLEEFVVRGGNNLRFSGLSHPNLKTLIVQSGGLSSASIRDLSSSNLPQLERIALWLGSENYGGDFTIEDLGPILRGEIWPKLEYLGLMNSEKSDAIARAIASSAILGRIRGLDVSMGTLSDEGGLALLSSPKLKALTLLNLRRHYLSEEVMTQFKKIGIEVDISGRQEAEEDDRYCEVSE